MRISIHICTLNRPAELGILFASLLRQTHSEWDMILVDSSNPPIASYKHISDLLTRMKFEGHAVKIIQNNILNGPAHSRNLALYADDLNDLCVRIDDDSFCEPDYLERLVNLYEKKKMEGENVGAVGGIVPPFGTATYIRNSSNLQAFNKITFSEDASKLDFADDGGYCYLPERTLVSDHLRSSFLFSKKAAIEIGGNALETGEVGWREETIFCMKLKWKGYSLWTDTGAICWHLMASSGGRNRSNAGQHQMVEDHFRRWTIRMWNKNGKKY